jgi:hypothetical protein
MKPRLIAALLAALTLAPAGALLASGGAFGGAYVFASRSYSDNDPSVYGPFRFKYRNSANTEVQAELYRLGYYRGPIDGNVNAGTPTSRAIINYQRAHRLPITGAIDGDLIAALGTGR